MFRFIFEKPKTTFTIASIILSLAISIILSLLTKNSSALILFFPLSISFAAYGFGFWVKETVTTPYKFAKKYFGEFYREGSSIANYIGLSDTVSGGEKFNLAPIPLFSGGRTFLLPGIEIIEVDLSPHAKKFVEDKIFVEGVELEIELEASISISEGHFAQFNKTVGGISKKTEEKHFDLSFLQFSRTASQLLRDDIENSGAQTYKEAIKLNKVFIQQLKEQLYKAEDGITPNDPINNISLTDPENKPVLIEEIGVFISRMELEIRSKDPRVQKMNEEIVVSELEAKASENKKKTMKNLGESLADAVKPIVDVLSGNKKTNAAQVANSSVTLLRSALPGAKIDQSIIDLNDQSGKAGINVRGGRK